MSVFASLFYEGTLPSTLTQADAQKVYPCNVNLSNDLVTIDYFSSYKKNNKLGSVSLKVSEFEVVEEKAASFMFTINAVVMKDASSTITLATFGNFPGKKLLGKQARTDELNEITAAILNAQKMARSITSSIPQTSPQTSISDDGVIYSFHGARGRHLTVYRDKCVIKTKVTAGSFLTGNVTDGEKTIYYADCIGVQFRPAGALIGYLQLETASSTMNNKNDNFFNENSFTFDKTQVPNSKMEEVASYIKSRVEEYKTARFAPATTTIIQNNFSSADEIKKFKELLDMGAITQEEFDAKKKELLGL